MCHKPALIIFIVFCCLLPAADCLCAQDPNSPSDSNDSNGPTVSLSYNQADRAENPTSYFLYFVPLIAPARVDMEISPDNQQKAWLHSYDKKVTDNSFYISCGFEMRGKGIFNNILDPNDVMLVFDEEMKRREPIKNALEYIKFEGEGFGRIEVFGTMDDSKEMANEVRVHFNGKGSKSPITIGLYCIDPVNGKYDYNKRYNELVARVATLTFKWTQNIPTMDVTVRSVNKAVKPNSYIGRIKGFIVNFFIDPVRISKIGNDTMLRFGYALYKQNPTFTFPRATNIKQIKD